MKETVLRIISGLVISGCALFALLNSRIYFSVLPLILVSVFALLGVIEYYRLTDRGLAGRALRGPGVIVSVLIILAFYAQMLHVQSQQNFTAYDGLIGLFMKLFHPGFNLTAGLLVILFIVAMSHQLVMRPLDGAIYSVAVTVFGVVYACLPFAHILLYLNFNNFIFYAVFFLLGPVMSDTGAYFGGRAFGRHNAGLKVSPRKTYEGYVSGVVFANLIALAFVFGWNSILSPAPFGYVETSVLTFIISIVSIFGDLVESAMKRDAQTKDSASLIPGHGGMLDLVDAILFILPLGYYYLHYKSILGFHV